MSEFILGLLRHVIIESMKKTDEDGICCIEQIVLNSSLAKAYREAIAKKKTIPIDATAATVPTPTLESFQGLIANFDGVWLIEDTHAYQPMVLGRRVTETERRMRK